MNTYSVVLVNPEIPPNTGNIIRLCANTNTKIHIIKPIGFELNQKSFKRAGMDYLKKVKISVYENITQFLKQNSFNRFFLVSKYGDKNYSKINYVSGDCFIFGSESKGLPNSVTNKFQSSTKIFIPMALGSRSINLANAVSIVIYEALRQRQFQFL